MSLTLEALEGAWQVTRRVWGHPGAARMTGEARFIPDGMGLTEEITGVMILPGAAPMQVTRRLLWRDEGGIAIRFEDGRPFARPGAGGRLWFGHDCPPDTYIGRITLGPGAHWRQSWRVRGPRKDYRMVTLYARA